jgi:hypothetical protein
MAAATGTCGSPAAVLPASLDSVTSRPATAMTARIAATPDIRNTTAMRYGKPSLFGGFPRQQLQGFDRSIRVRKASHDFIQQPSPRHAIGF